MIGRSMQFRIVLTRIDKMALFDAPVLIEGETGTGKELAARAIHYRGTRSGGPFVPVNCGAIPDTLIENELFGHCRGAFTDARSDHTGLVELARGGTLFLDEVDALTPKAQVTLLRFLQDRQFRPLGGRREEQADVRILAASNRVLEMQVEAGAFRLDLLYRLKLMHLTLPPLRERREDIALLAEHFVAQGSARYRKAALPIDSATLEWFEHYAWPGNIRELEHLVQREFLLADGDCIRVAPPQVSAVEPGAPSLLNYRQPHGLAAEPSAPALLNYRQAKSRAIAEFESRFLAELMGHAQGNVSAAARISGTERRHLGRLLKKHRIAKVSSEA